MMTSRQFASRMRHSFSLGISILAIWSHAAQADQFVTYTDPTEGAFTIEVPQGWNVQGGLLRYSPLSFNIVMQMQASDGEQIKLGDANILPFTAPAYGTPPIGSKYNVGQGVVMMVLPYMTGAEFAQQWGGSVLKHICSNQRFLSGNPVPPSGGGASGQAIYACGDKIAYVFATTTRIMGPADHWQATDSIIGLAPPDKIQHTVDVIFHLIGTARFTPNWFLAQSQRWGMAIDVARQTTDDLMRKQAQKSINTPGSVNSSVDQTVRGYTTSPHGNEVEIQGHGNYYWNCGGKEVNTQSYLSPGPNCTPK